MERNPSMDRKLRQISEEIKVPVGQLRRGLSNEGKRILGAALNGDDESAADTGGAGRSVQEAAFPAAPSTFTDAENSEGKDTFRAGDIVLAPWWEDSCFYPAEILRLVHSRGQEMARVRFEGYDEYETVAVADLRKTTQLRQPSFDRQHSLGNANDFGDFSAQDAPSVGAGGKMQKVETGKQRGGTGSNGRIYSSKHIRAQERLFANKSSKQVKKGPRSHK